MHRSLLLCLLTAALAAQAPVPRRRRRPRSPSPGISPDGSEIAFVSGGDIWTVPAAGGEARLLVSNAATESRPVYSPDKTQLAFVSTRTGGGDIYVLTFATGDVRRVTFDDGLDQLDGWSRDGKWLYFFSNAHDLVGRHERRLSRARPTAARRCRSAATATRTSSSPRRRPTARRWRCRRAATRRGSGGGTATAISTKRRSGCAI